MLFLPIRKQRAMMLSVLERHPPLKGHHVLALCGFAALSTVGTVLLETQKEGSIETKNVSLASNISFWMHHCLVEIHSLERERVSRSVKVGGDLAC